MTKLKDYSLLFATFLLYALSVLFSKIASGQSVPMRFVLYYGISLLFMAFYAVAWQVSLKRVPLSIAYPLKSVTLILGMLFGFFLFHDELHWNMILGAVIILFGVYLVTRHE